MRRRPFPASKLVNVENSILWITLNVVRGQPLKDTFSHQKLNAQNDCYIKHFIITEKISESLFVDLKTPLTKTNIFVVFAIFLCELDLLIV